MKLLIPSGQQFKSVSFKFLWFFKDVPEANVLQDARKLNSKIIQSIVFEKPPVEILSRMTRFLYRIKVVTVGFRITVFTI